jgi:hypothetical protein
MNGRNPEKFSWLLKFGRFFFLAMGMFKIENRQSRFSIQFI